MSRRRAEGPADPLAEACNAVRAFGNVKQESLTLDMRDRLKKACLLLMKQPRDALLPHQRALSEQALNVMRGSNEILPGLTRSTLQEYGTLVRDDAFQHGRRAVLIKHWHGTPTSLIDDRKHSFIQHQRAVGDALASIQKSVDRCPNGTYFLFETAQFSLGDPEPHDLRDHNFKIIDQVVALHAQTRRQPPNIVLHRIWQEYSKAPDGKHYLEQLAQKLQPENPTFQWLWKETNRHLHLQGRPMERIDPYGKFTQRIEALAREPIDPTDEQLIELKEAFIRERNLDDGIRHTFVRDQCLALSDDANVVILYGGGHMREGFTSDDTSIVGLEQYVQDRFDVTVLEPQYYEMMAGNIRQTSTLTMNDLRKMVQKRQEALRSGK